MCDFGVTLRVMAKISPVPRFAVPAFVATIAGIGLDLMGNILPQAWPDAPHYVWTILLAISFLMISAFPIWLFWWLLRWLLGKSSVSANRIAWKSISITESNLSAYMRSSPLVQKLDERIAGDARLTIKSDQSAAFPQVENAKLFGISDIAELDKLLEENQEALVRMSHYSWPAEGTNILRGHSILYLFNVLSAQLGEEKYVQLSELRQLTLITPQGIIKEINAYKEISKNIPINVRVPLIPDFNLVPIEQALAMVRDQTKGSAFSKSIASGTRESELLVYFAFLKDKLLRLYGSRKGENQRRPAPDMTAIVSQRFEAGKVVVDCQIPHTAHYSKNVTYERLYVLRPDLERVIGQLNEAKTTN
jgi:hypothetical protein